MNQHDLQRALGQLHAAIEGLDIDPPWDWERALAAERLADQLCPPGEPDLDRAIERVEQATLTIKEMG